MKNVWAAATSRNTSWNVGERLAFCPPQPSYDIDSFPGELIFIPPAAGSVASDASDAKIPCIFLSSQYARFILICFHANGEDLGKIYPFLCAMRDVFKVHILAIEYPGYGICSGVPSESGVLVNAHAAMYFATETLKWPYDGIKLFGRSVGTGPAMALAAQYPVAGLILITPFLSIREVLRAYIGSLADYADDCFRNYKLAEHIESPTLIVHGKQDDLIPIAHGLKLYDALQCSKMMVCPENMHHNASLLDGVATFIKPMTHFFSLPDFIFVDIELPQWVKLRADEKMRSRLSDTKGDATKPVETSRGGPYLVMQQFTKISPICENSV